VSAGRALWFQARGNAVLRDEPLPELGPGFSLVRASFSAVSPGTEQLVFSGRVPPPMHATMRVPYMAGDFGFPVKYGYSLVGRVESSDDAALRGCLVHLMHPHQDRLVARDADLFLVPEGVAAPRATLASSLETAVNALWDSGATIGDRCLVAGFGIIGSLIARLLARMPGVDVVVADPEASKIDLASRLGFAALQPGRVQGNFDIAFHASSTGEGLQLCIDRTGFEGTIVEASWYGSRPVTVELGQGFHSERKRIVSTQVSTVAASMRARWSLARRKALVFELLRDACFDAHLTESIAFDDLPAYCNAGGLAKPGLARVVAYGASEGEPCSS
jgi:threonine dehydrogenase-like Zn-dependent dehydrogenase